MGGATASKVQLKSKQKSRQHNKRYQNPESPQIKQKIPKREKKTELSPFYSEIENDQDDDNFKSKIQPATYPVFQQISLLQKKSSDSTKVQPHKNKINQSKIPSSQNEFLQNSKSQSFKVKENKKISQELYNKYCLILELSEKDGHDLSKIKKVYPKLAKRSKNDNQKLIELNQAFIFLRVSYFKTQFGTSAVHQNDSLQIFEKHCDALNLSKNEALKLERLKSNFTSIMTVHRLNKSKRIQISIAYEYLANCIFKVERSCEEIKLIDAVIVCDKETLIQMFSENKDLVNFRQKGSDYPLLYIAVRSGHYEIVELILRTGCHRNFEGERSTPLHCAAFYEHKQILQLLLAYGLPYNVKNSSGYFPIDEAMTDEVKRILKNVKEDQVQDLILSLTKQSICQGCINIKESNGNVIARKILLSNYFDEYKDHDDAFHGTTFQALESIAKHGLKKPGTIVDGQLIKVAAGHIGQDRLEIEQLEEKKDTWQNAVFLSPSYNYASCPCYSKDQITMNHITGQRDQWAPLIQAKVKKNSFSRSQSTTDEHEVLKNEPFQLEYRVEDSDNVTVVALILIRRQYMREKQNQNYMKTTEFLLNSKEETQFMCKSQPSSPQKLSKMLGNLSDSRFQNLIMYLTQQNLFKSKFSLYHENGTMMGRKIFLKSGIQDKKNYVDGFHVTDYNSLWKLKNYGFARLLNDKQQMFISPTIFEYSQLNSLPKQMIKNTTTFQAEEWSVILHIKVHKSIFLQSNRSEHFISNWKELSNIKFRIKAELLQQLNLRLRVVGLIFVNVKSINSNKKYDIIVSKMR